MRKTAARPPRWCRFVRYSFVWPRSRASGALALLLLGLFWMSSGKASPALLDDVSPYRTSGVIAAGVGCKLVGGSLVCGRGAGGLLDRKILPRKRKEAAPVQKKPVQTKPAKKTAPSKSTTSTGSKSKSSGGSSSVGGGTEAPAQEPADVDEKSGEAEAEQPASAKDALSAVQDDTPPAPSPRPERPDTAEPETASEASAGSTEIPDDIRAAACGPGAPPGGCACPDGSAYDSDACKIALPSCCSASVSAGGTPQPAISRCGADQNKAMTALVSSAMEKKLTLGPVRCTNQ
jgi:hypothetical protein